MREINVYLINCVFPLCKGRKYVKVYILNRELKTCFKTAKTSFEVIIKKMKMHFWMTKIVWQVITQAFYLIMRFSIAGVSLPSSIEACNWRKNGIMNGIETDDQLLILNKGPSKMFARSSRLCSSTWEVARVLQHRAPCLSSSYLRVSFYFKLWCESILYLDAPQAANHISEMKLFSLFSSLFLCFAYLVWTGQSSHAVTSVPSNSPSCFPTLLLVL